MRTRIIACLAAAALVALVGCGADDNVSTGDEATTPSEATAPDTASTASAPSASPSEATTTSPPTTATSDPAPPPTGPGAAPSGSGTACLTGAYVVSSFTSDLLPDLGAGGVVGTDGEMTVSFDSGRWTLSDNGDVDVSVSAAGIEGTLTVTGDATGTFVAGTGAGEVTFAMEHASGTVAATIGGADFDFSVDDLATGLVPDGTASVSCTGTGTTAETTLTTKLGEVHLTPA